MATDERGAVAEAELGAKLAVVRAQLAPAGLAAIRLRGADWFAWLTGGSSIVDTSSELGVAEVLITATGVTVITNQIDAQRLREEEVPRCVDFVSLAWSQPGVADAYVRSQLGRAARVASDRPRRDERRLPEALVCARLSLMPSEIERFRTMSADAASALTRVLMHVRPEMTEQRVAAMTHEELVGCDTWPVVVLVGGERRLTRFRHPTPRVNELIGARAMIVICARRGGLVTNLTRFVYFRPLTLDERVSMTAVGEVEAAALDASVPGATLGDIYRVIAARYARAGFRGAEQSHHQGGIAGYLTREELATPTSRTRLTEGTALAWNPSLPGAKMEDTFVMAAGGLELLTVDSRWPVVNVNGRPRPAPLVAP